MGMVDALAMGLPTFLVPAGPQKPTSGHRVSNCGENIGLVTAERDVTGNVPSLLRPQGPSPKRTLFKPCIYPMHGSLTDTGWRFRLQDAIYDLLEMRII